MNQNRTRQVPFPMRRSRVFAFVNRMLRGRRLTWGLVLLIALLSALDYAGAFGSFRSDRTRYADRLAVVTDIVDGITIQIDVPDGEWALTPVRLRGLAIGPVADDGGETPSVAYLREQIVGRRVVIVLDPNHPTRDAAGLLSAYVYLKDTGEMVNELLIQRRFVQAERRTPHVMQQRFMNLE